jgi:hypothetical protein
MVQPIAHIVLPDSESDLYLTQAVARLSSSPAAREMARAWLAAYDLARASDTPQAQPIGKAGRSFHVDVDGSTRCAGPDLAEDRAA